MYKKATKKVLLGGLVIGTAAALTACGSVDNPDGYNYNTYTSVSPSNWNELTYQDSNDTQIMDYIATSLFEYDFKFDADGEIVKDGYEVKYSAAKGLVDRSSEQGKSNGTVWEITLRDDLQWNDGTPIVAADFVYSMEQLLDPDFLNYRASSYYESTTAIVGAYDYAKSGLMTYDFEPGTNASNITKGSDGVYTFGGEKVVFSIFDEVFEKIDSYSLLDEYEYYLDGDADADAAWAIITADMDSRGYVYVTDETLAAMDELVELLIVENQAGGYPYPSANITSYNLMAVETGLAAKLDFAETVNFKATSEYVLQFELETACNLLNVDNTLSYQAAYNMASLPLVHEELYEANKVAPALGSTLWSSTYNSSVDTTASWGPYDLTKFQSGKVYELTKNEDWFGFDFEQNDGLFQTQKIVCETISEWSTAWLKFQKGQLDTIGIDVSISEDYKGSERAYYTPSSFIASLQVQSDEASIKSYSASNSTNNTQLLLYPEFREALSLAVNNQAFASQTTTSSLAGFGLFNTMHYHDVANGSTYRSTTAAKMALIETYGVDLSEFNNDLDAAVASITGYDVERAAALMTTAYNEALADGNFSANDKINLRISTSGVTASFTRQMEFLDAAMKAAAVGTPLEGKISVSYIDNGTAWATNFRAGAGELCLGGWSGAAWDPGYFLSAYLGDSRYAKGWQPTTEMMTYTMKLPTGNVTETASLWTWYQWLNGSSTRPAGADGTFHNWSSSNLSQSYRVELIAELEKQILQSTYVVPLYNSFSASLISYKIDYATYEYNTFMAYGGIKYMTYNYTNGDWSSIASNADYKA
ncbi:MAG: ABC transporter substrate-binding protein [bacterium]